MWEFLGGVKNKHVTLNNLRMFLFAIQNVMIEHGPTVSADDLKPLPDSKIGKFNAHGDLFLSVQDMKYIP